MPDYNYDDVISKVEYVDYDADNRTTIVIDAEIIDINDIDSSAVAGMEDKDLMAVRFKLVHANINANRDEFKVDELAISEGTPIYKPINWEHTDRIIGVITKSRYVAVDNVAEGDGEKEDDYLECEGLIYSYLFPSYATEMRKRHENGELSYSMEVCFEEAECSVCGEKFSRRVDYCDHLKGRFNANSNASRILRGLTFVGAGVVNRPADKDAKNLSIAKDLDEKNKGFDMPRTEEGKFIFDSQTELNEYVKAEVENKINELKDQNGVDELQASFDEATAKISSLEEAAEVMQQKLDELEASKAEVEKEFKDFKDTIDAEKLMAARLSSLEEDGIKLPEDEELKDKLIASIKKMDDESFEVFRSFSKANVKVEEDTDDDKTVVDQSNASSGSNESKFPSLDKIMGKE